MSRPVLLLLAALAGCESGPTLVDLPDRDRDGVRDPDDPCPDDRSDALTDGRCDHAYPASLSLPPPRAVLQRDGDTCLARVEGTLGGFARPEVIVEVFTDGEPVGSVPAPVRADGWFSVEAPLAAGLRSHELRVRAWAGDEVYAVGSVRDLACGDLAVIDGQSNAVAGDYSGEGLANTWQSPWVRSVGTTAEDPFVTDLAWHDADGEAFAAPGAVGAWALRMAHALVEGHEMPIGLVNGAVGGTPIAWHHRNDRNPTDPTTIYGRLLARASAGGVADDAKLLFWYQGETDGAEVEEGVGPRDYASNFARLRDDWSHDYPSLERIYVMQVRGGCGVDPLQDGRLAVTFTDEQGQHAATTSTGVRARRDDWTSWHLHAVAPPWATAATAEVWVAGTGPITVDDVSLRTHPAGDELLENGGFEDGAPYAVDPWTTASWAGNVLVDEYVRSGARAVRLDGDASLVQTVPVAPGTVVTLEAWARAEATGPDVRAVQAALPATYPEVSVVSTTGMVGHDGCHYSTAGYEQLGLVLARRLSTSVFGAAADPEMFSPAVTEAFLQSPDTIELVFGGFEGTLVLGEGFEEGFVVAGTHVTGADVGGNRLRLRLHEPVPDGPIEVSYVGRVGADGAVTTARGVGILSFFDLPVARP